MGTAPATLLDRGAFRVCVAVLFVGVTGFLTYIPVAVVRLLAADTMWPVPAGERWVVTWTIGWYVVMALATAGMLLYVLDSFRSRTA